MAAKKNNGRIVEFLVNEVQVHESLWKKTSSNFKDVFVKANAWKEIFSNIEATFCKKDLVACKVDTIRGLKLKWKNTRDLYVRKKKGAGGKSGTSFDAMQKKKDWPLFRTLSFLDQRDSYPGGTSGTASHINDQSEDDDSNNDNDDNDDTDDSYDDYDNHDNKDDDDIIEVDNDDNGQDEDDLMSLSDDLSSNSCNKLSDKNVTSKVQKKVIVQSKMSSSEDVPDTRKGPPVSLIQMALNGKLDHLEGDKLFSSNHCRAKLAAARVAKGLPLVRHRNGKIDMGSLLDKNVAREHLCNYCDHSFAYSHILRRHVKRIHEKHLTTTFKCSKCTYSTVWKDQIRSHFSVVHQKFKPYVCSVCPFRAPQSCRVTTHIQQRHEGIGFFIFDSQLKPRSVSPSLTDTNPKFCQKLEPLSDDVQFFKFEQEPLQQAVKEEVTDFPDDTIEFKVETVQDVDDDDEVEDDSSSFHCPFCNFKSPSQLDMGEHVIATHEQGGGSSNQVRSRSSPLFPCEMCGRQYQNVSKLEQHYKKDHPHVILVLPGNRRKI